MAMGTSFLREGIWPSDLTETGDHESVLSLGLGLLLVGLLVLAHHVVFEDLVWILEAGLGHGTHSGPGPLGVLQVPQSGSKQLLNLIFSRQAASCWILVSPLQESNVVQFSAPFDVFGE